MDQNAQIHLLASAALGYALQWLMFGPKKVPIVWCWVGLCGLSVAVYWWATPTALVDWQTNWRLFLFSVIQFVLTAKGTGSTAKAFGAAPGTNTIGA